MHADFHGLLFTALVIGALFDGIQHFFQLFANKHGNDGRRCFVCTETVVVARTGNRDTEQILIFVDRLDNGDQEEKELCVFIRRCAGIEQVLSLIGGNRPVVMLAAAVDTGERFFM